MARILIATVPVMGHIAPFLPLARALAERGHDIRWYTGAKYRAWVEATGAEFAGYRHARDFDDREHDREFPGRARLRGLAQLKFDMKNIFIEAAPGQLADIRALLDDFPADVVLHDPGMIGALLQHEQGGPPTGILGIVPMVVSSVDAAPFGLGLLPSATPLGRMRNRALNWFVQNAAFRDVQKCWNHMRARVNLGPTGWWMDQVRRASFYLQPTVPSFEYPRSDLPDNVQFIGMLPAARAASAPMPPFWGDLDGSRPVVHVTQGTIANAAPHLIAPALEGLASLDVLVVVSTGNRPVRELGLGALPANARVAEFLSYPELLPKLSAMITNGGYGGVQMALSHGVPVVVAGASEDKPEVAARVAWSGAGLDLKTGTPTPRAVRDAVRKVLNDPRYRARARALAAEYERHDAIARAVEIVEASAGLASRAGNTAALSSSSLHHLESEVGRPESRSNLPS
jgi:MGT family glycosyltransferase